MIADAMKTRNMGKLEALRMIKATLVKAHKDGTEMTEANEAKIIQKMVKQTEDAIAQFKAAGREDLAAKETADLEVIKEFAPEEVKDEEIIALATDICKEMENNGTVVNMSVMRPIIAKVQERFPTASGKIISQVVRNWGK